MCTSATLTENIMTSYTEAFEQTIQTWALARIPAKRHQHVCGVVQTADEMARRFLPEAAQLARLAGWLHDSAKHLSDNELQAIAAQHGYQPTAEEQMVPMLLHGRVGYLVAADEFDLDDAALMTACAFHTTGDPSMNTLDKILLVADLIEPTRSFESLKEIRHVAKESLDDALLLALDVTIKHLLSKQAIIDTRAVQTRNKLLLEQR